jgi:hypothetical protein
MTTRFGQLTVIRLSLQNSEQDANIVVFDGNQELFYLTLMYLQNITGYYLSKKSPFLLTLNS